MQVPDIVQTTPEKARILRNEMLPLPYVYAGLSVQGVSPTRLTPAANPNINVTPEFAAGISARHVVKRFLESRTAIAMVGLGLRPAARTVSAHVQAAIFFAGLARKVANSPDRTLTPKPAPPSNLPEGVEPAGMRGSDKAIYWVDEADKLDNEVELEPEVEL